MMFGDTAYSIISVQKWDTSGYGVEGIKTKRRERERDTMFVLFLLFFIGKILKKFIHYLLLQVVLAVTKTS